MKKATLQIFTAILVLGLFCGTAAAVPSVIGVISPDQNSTVTGTVGATQTFTIPLNETANVIWTENGTDTSPLPTDGSNVATLSHVFQSGSYQVTARIDGVGQIAAWNVQGTEGALSITSKSPENNPSTGTNATQEFSVGTNKAADITWYINGIAVDSVSGVTSDTYQNVSSTAGTY
jgi:hypothetical protein